jgi:glycosyltransferase involved in cell wall biosynthesis
VLAAALARTGATPVVAVHHDFPPGRRVAGGLRRATGRAGAVVATSRAVAEALELGGAATILHPGVDLAAWTPLPTPPPGPPRALVLGALVPWKRADLALDVAARLPDLRLTIAGAPIDGEDAHAAVLHERAGAADLRDRVEFAGRVSDPRTVLAGAHLLLHCADAEPFGLVLVEAMAAGRPVVAAGAGGPLEIVGDVGGRLFAPGDAAAAAAAVRAVLADPGAGPGARRRAEDFPVEASAARLAAAIASVAP